MMTEMPTTLTPIMFAVNFNEDYTSFMMRVFSTDAPYEVYMRCWLGMNDTPHHTAFERRLYETIGDERIWFEHYKMDKNNTEYISRILEYPVSVIDIHVPYTSNKLREEWKDVPVILISEMSNSMFLQPIPNNFRKEQYILKTVYIHYIDNVRLKIINVGVAGKHSNQKYFQADVTVLDTRTNKTYKVETNFIKQI